MKSQLLKEWLIDTTEAKAEVSPELHQNIMRAVRLATAHDKRTSPAWTVPAWGAGVAVLALSIFYLAQTTPGVPAQSAPLVQTQKTAQALSLLKLGDKLAAFSEDTLLPEKELMEEFERLKSDLKRLGFTS